MPELPEVENTVSRIASEITGKRIRAAQVLWKRTITEPNVAQFKRILANATVSAVTRRGKFVVLHLRTKHTHTTNYYLFIHLRMAGSLHLRPAKLPPDKFVRMILQLTGGKALCFRDIRKFGRVSLTSDYKKISDRLGIDALDPQFNYRSLQQILGKKSGAIKPILLNQKLIAGIGNIYADESLWRARINPYHKASSLTPTEIKRLNNSIRLVLLAAIRMGGTDNGDGVVAGNNKPKVYGKNGDRCPRCRTLIVKTRIAQRGTHYCTKCQPLLKSNRIANIF